MNKSKFFLIGLLSVALVFGMTVTSCNGEEDAWGAGGGVPEFTKLAIAGRAVTLGTPNENAADATLGYVTLKSKEKDDQGAPYLLHPLVKYCDSRFL
jgi:hypothetical protein